MARKLIQSITKPFSWKKKKDEEEDKTTVSRPDKIHLPAHKSLNFDSSSWRY